MPNEKQDNARAAKLPQHPSAPARHPYLGYGIALVATLAAVAVRLLFAPILDQNAPFLFFIAAVLIGATVEGLGPGLLSLVVGLGLALLFFVELDRGGIAIPSRSS